MIPDKKTAHSGFFTDETAIAKAHISVLRLRQLFDCQGKAMPLVNYKLIGEALEFYAEKGYRYIDVPWSATKEALMVTAGAFPDAQLYPYRNEFLVASGEQSFIQMLQERKLAHGTPYMCVTPCFRDEKTHNRFTRPYFIKLELILAGSANPGDADILMGHAAEYFNRYLPRPVSFVKTDIGTDIFYNGVELGSYGLRNHTTTGPWVYATGVAEPRFSQVLADVPKGYGVAPIARGKFGELSKIAEEVEELKDAEAQGVDIMSLVELADIYGAMEGYLSKRFPRMTMEDIRKMSAVTRRSFENGFRI